MPVTLLLRSSPASPFGRKVKLAASILGLKHRLTIEAANTLDPIDTLRTQNPLGKIPTLVLEDGTTLFDSRVIVEYLDLLAGGGVILPAGMARFDALRRQALADGLMDAALLLVYEGRFREEPHRSAMWTDHQRGKLERALEAFAALAAGPCLAKPDVGEIALACALGYLDLRFQGSWRSTYPGLVAWLATFSETVPAFAETVPVA